MARTYERKGRPALPQWWVDLAFPLLEHKNTDLAHVAQAASEAAGRKSPWKRDAISKFKSGKAVTRELANGISAALRIPRPYFEARNENEARTMMSMQGIYLDPPTVTPGQSGKLAALDRAAEMEHQKILPQVDRTVVVSSGDETAGGSRRTRRVTRGRS